MNALELLYATDKGNLEGERVVLKATTQLDLIGHILINSFSEDGQSCFDLNDKVYWFPQKVINAGEYVRVYTKGGKDGVTNGKFRGEPAVFHDFYWGLKNPIWTEKSNAVVIFQIQTWYLKKI